MLLFFPLLSCTDQGCIEADDFGEYQTQVLEVHANAAQSACAYNSALELTDTNQGSGIKTCLTSGAATVSYESGVVQRTLSGGCNGNQVNGSGSTINSSGAVTTDENSMVKMDASHINYCADSCVQACLNGSGGPGGAAPEPNWKATDPKSSSQNSGLQILPGSQISITATGSVTLSKSANYLTIYMPVDGLSSGSTNSGMVPNYKDATWSNEAIFNVNAGQNFNTKFSGHWTRPYANGVVSAIPDSYYYGSSEIGGSTALAPNSSWNTAVYNQARHLVAYTIPHPDGYIFDSSQATEIAGTKGTPLLPDPKTWICDYDASKNPSPINAATYPHLSESNCHLVANGYQTLLGYAASVDAATASNPLFKIQSNAQSEGLGTYGGVIRWTGDGISEAAGDIFANSYSRDFDVISSTELSIPAGSSVKSDNISPQVVGSQSLTIPSSGITFTNNDTMPYMMFVRSNSSACATATNSSYVMTATVKDSLGNNITEKVGLQLPLTNGGWGEPYTPISRITLEPGQKVILLPPPPSACSLNGALAVKFQKFKDITVNQSGFVRFTILNASSGTCTLNGRILNARNTDGSPRTDTNPDYYEYDDFSNIPSSDPLDALSVPSSGSLSQSWSSKVFVRKGQTIRLSPISWNSNFTTSNNVTRQCGIGMVMQITPRPAVLCKGITTEPITNPDSRCLVDYDLVSGSLVGCKANASECNDRNNASYYCPYSDCRSTISCTPGTAANNYTKTGCTATSNIGSAACVTALSSLSAANQANFASSCGNSYCSSKMLANAQLPATTGQAVDQCYDLENYTGKVSSIPNASTAGMMSSSNTFFDKGGARLGVFNGYYGNFDQFADSGNRDTNANNIIYQSKNILTFAQNSRLKFLFATNNGDFRKLDTNYSSKLSSGGDILYRDTSSARGAGYNGNNGMKISFDGTLQFSNGQWLEAKLCRETDTHSCRGPSINTTATAADVAIDAQPHLIDLVSPTVSTDSTPRLASTAKYQFDGFGILSRVADPASKDCSIANQGIDTQKGNPYYCHTYLNSTSSYIYDSNNTDPFSDSDYDELNKLRLTFKIKDPEIPNCIIPGSGATTNNGVRIENPAYQPDTCYTGSNCIATSGGSYTTSCGSTAACTGYVSSGRCLTPTSNMYNGFFSGNTCLANSNAVGLTCGYTSTGTVDPSDDGRTPSLSSSNPCRKQFYCGSIYSNNSGSYFVTVKVSNPPGNNISNIIGGVITPVIEAMDGRRSIDASGKVTQTVGQSQRIYTLLVQDGRYQAILSMCMAMMIMFYGVTYLMGITDLSSSDLINRCIKIALIYFFSSPTGWYWFNLFVVKWFKDGTDYLAFMMASSFDDSPSLARALSLNDYYDKSVLFSSVDKVFGMFFSQAVQKKVSALLFASIFGWVYLWIIYLSFMLYVYAVGYAVLYYLTAQIFISILFTLGPIFFIFTLFNQTKGMFDSWLNQLIGFSLQQIFLLTTLAFFNMMMYEVIKMSLGYKICWDEVWTINIITRISLLSFWTIASLPPSVNSQSQVGEIGHPEGIPSLFSILFIWVIASLMKNFIKFMTDLGASIGGSVKASAMASGALKAINDAKAYSSEKFNDVAKATIGEPMKRLDAALFDSGEHADKARKERQDKNRQDQGKKESLAKAGDAAMSKYKRENAAEFAGLSEDKKKEKLLAAKESGMKAEAKKLGISDKELESLKKDKGLKYEGSNLLVAAAQAARQKAGFGGGTLDKSLNEGKINTSMKFSEAKEGMSKMSKEERGKFIDQAKKGDVKVDKSMSQKVIGGAKSLANATAKPAAGLAMGVAAGAAGLASDSASAALHKLSGGRMGDDSFASTKANLESAKEKAVGAVKGLASGADTAGSSLARAAKNIAGKAQNAVGGNEFDDARKRLEESGKIRRMASAETNVLGKRLAVGTNFARSSDEKQQIRDEVMRNREEKKTATPTKNDSTTIGKLGAVDRGLTKSEENPVSSTLGALDEKLFGAGGVSHAVSENLPGGQKSKDAEAHSTEGVSAVADKLSDTGAIQQDESEKKQLKTTQDAAQKASTAIRAVQALEKELKGSPEPLTKTQTAARAVRTAVGLKNPPLKITPPTAERAAQIKQEIADIKTADAAVTNEDGSLAKNEDGSLKGGSGHFQNQEKMAELQGKAESASTPEEKEQVAQEMSELTSKENYVEGGLDGANASYQESTQKIATIDARLEKTKPMAAAAKASSAAFDKASNSNRAKSAEDRYKEVSNFDKMTGGRFNKEARVAIKENNVVQNMKKDYAALGKLSGKDFDATRTTKDGKEKTSKAAQAHQEFADKYKDFGVVAAGNGEAGAGTPEATTPTATPPTGPTAAPPSGNSVVGGGAPSGSLNDIDE